MTEALIGVVIPTHNRRELLADTLAAVLAERAVGLEVVVVDDCSTDGTSEWLATVDDRRVRFVTLNPGRRAAAARNVGLAEVTSPYVMTLDDDDVICPGALPLLLDALQRHTGCAGSAGANVTFGATPPHRQPHPPVPVRTTIWREEMFGWNLPPGTSLWHTGAVRDAGGWDESLPRCEDLEFNLRLGRNRVALVPQTVLRYRQHGGQAVGDVRAFDLVLDRDIRDRFIDGLPPRDKAEAERVLQARLAFPAALEAYEAGDHRVAARRLVAMFRTAPYLARSPVIAPWLLGMLAKASAATVLPSSVRRSVSDARRARRTRRLSTDDGAM